MFYSFTYVIPNKKQMIRTFNQINIRYYLKLRIPMCHRQFQTHCNDLITRIRIQIIVMISYNSI